VEYLILNQDLVFYNTGIRNNAHKIPCTGNDATGNQYRVTGGHGGIRLCKDAQFGATSTKVLKTTNI
jgi:hypothetical protein